MKSTVTLILLLTFYTNFLFSQLVITYNPINLNNCNAQVNTSGFLFYHPFDPGYEVPTGSGNSTLYTSHIWLGGINMSTGDLHLTGGMYHAASNFDLWHGPVADTYDSTYDQRYDYIWRVYASEIQDHINGISTSQNILKWPAHGDTTNGEAYFLAPFVDVDSNGIYDPSAGDYPDIRGDVTVYTIYNDDRELNLATNGTNLKVEIHRMVYQFTDSSAINNTTFVSYKIINRSDNIYTDFYLGTFDDFDLGDPYDDFLGCSPNQNLYYVYNGDPFDNSSTQGPGYGADPPAMGVKYLNVKLNSFVYFNNIGPGIDLGTTDPQFSDEYYQYLQGLWRDGSDIYEWGTGHASDPNTSTTTTNYVFPGDPADTTQWSEISSGNTPGDRRALGTGGLSVMAPGTEFCVDMAYIYSRSYAGHAYSSVHQLYEDADSVQDFYNNQNFDCWYSPTTIPNSVAEIDNLPNLNIYPNPAVDYLTVDFGKRLESGFIRVYDATQRLMWQGSVSNVATFRLNTTNFPNGVYFLHISENKLDAASKFIINK